MTHETLHPCQILSGSDKPIQRSIYALLSFRGHEKKLGNTYIQYIDVKRSVITISRRIKILTDSDSARRGGVLFIFRV